MGSQKIDRDILNLFTYKCYSVVAPRNTFCFIGRRERRILTGTDPQYLSPADS